MLYEVITAADAIARYHRMKGKKVFFLTGTDEHGEKVHKSATQQGMSPKELADRVVTRFQGLTPALHITNDDFIRTSEPRHYASAQARITSYNVCYTKLLRIR